MWYSRRLHRGRRLMPQRYPELNADALLPYSSSWNMLARRIGTSTPVLRRDAAKGLTLQKADRYAVALGLHPAEIWPAWVELFEQERRQQRTKATMRWRAQPEAHARHLEARRAYYAENGDYERQRERARYWAKRDVILAKRREKRARERLDDVRCPSCKSVYLVPDGAMSVGFEVRRALDWLVSHECRQAS